MPFGFPSTMNPTYPVAGYDYPLVMGGGLFGDSYITHYDSGMYGYNRSNSIFAAGMNFLGMTIGMFADNGGYFGNLVASQSTPALSYALSPNVYYQNALFDGMYMFNDIPSLDDIPVYNPDASQEEETPAVEQQDIPVAQTGTSSSDNAATESTTTSTNASGSNGEEIDLEASWAKIAGDEDMIETWKAIGKLKEMFEGLDSDAVLAMDINTDLYINKEEFENFLKNNITGSFNNSTNKYVPLSRADYNYNLERLNASFGDDEQYYYIEIDDIKDIAKNGVIPETKEDVYGVYIKDTDDAIALLSAVKEASRGGHQNASSPERAKAILDEIAVLSLSSNINFQEITNKLNSEASGMTGLRRMIIGDGTSNQNVTVQQVAAFFTSPTKVGADAEKEDKINAVAGALYRGTAVEVEFASLEERAEVLKAVHGIFDRSYVNSTLNTGDLEFAKHGEGYSSAVFDIIESMDGGSNDENDYLTLKIRPDMVEALNDAGSDKVILYNRTAYEINHSEDFFSCFSAIDPVTNGFNVGKVGNTEVDNHDTYDETYYSWVLDSNN